MCKKHLLTAFLVLSALSGFAQYAPGSHVVVNDAVAPAQPTPLDARSMFYDGTNFIYRAYNGTSEVLTYLNTTASRSGHFIMVVDSGGSLQSNGTYIGGYNTFYMFKDSTVAGGLVKMNLFGTGAGTCSTCLLAANNLSDLGSLSTALVNLGLNNVNNTSDATKNAATVTLTNHTISGAANTITNLPNSSLNNSTIGLTLTNTGTTPQVTTTPAALGTSLVVTVPWTNGTDSGFLKGTDWAFFNGKLDSVRVSNDSVYNCVNGICTLQSVISGTGGVNSVNGTNTSLLFSPSTGNVLGQVNPAYAFNWTGQHTYSSFAPIFSTLTMPGGIFYGSNSSGQLSQSAAGTNGQIFESTGGTAPIFFTPNSGTVSGWLGYTPLSGTLPSTQIYVGNAMNTAQAVNLTGAASLSNTGVISLTSTITGGSCTSCDLTYNAAGQLTAAANGSTAGPTLNAYSYYGNPTGSSAAGTSVGFLAYNVKDYGLVDDSVTDNTTAFRTLFALLPNGARIYFPGGGKGYYFADSLLISKRVYIYGDGNAPFEIYVTPLTVMKGATNIYFSSTTNNLLCYDGNDTANTIPGTVTDLSIINTSATPPTAGSAIVLRGNVEFQNFNNLTISGFYDDIDIVSAAFTSIDKCNLVAPIQDALVIGNNVNVDEGGTRVTNTIIVSGTAATTTARGIYIRGGGGILLDNLEFNAQATLTPNTQFISDIYLDMADGETSEFHVTNCHFDNYQTYGVRGININYPTGINLPLFGINNCHFAPVDGSSTSYAIWLSHYNDITVGNYYTHGQTNANAFMRFDTCEGVGIIGPTIVDGYSTLYENHDSYIETIKYAPDATPFVFGASTSGTGSDVNISNTGTTSGFGVVSMQPTASNSAISVGIKPTGTPSGTKAAFGIVDNDESSGNFHYMNLSTDGIVMDISSLIVGTSSPLPFLMHSGISNGSQFILFPSGDVGINTASDIPSAQFFVSSATQGAIPAPVMTTTQFKAISSPASGLHAILSDSSYRLGLWNGSKYVTYATTDMLGTSSGVTTIGTFSGSSIANGASISGSTITFGPADGTNPGMVTTGTQTFLGTKNFGNITVESGSSSTAIIRHIEGSAPSSMPPSIAPGTGAGTSPTISLTGGDRNGVITVTTGTTPAGTSTIVTVTYHAAYDNDTYPVLFPANAITAALNGLTMVYTTGSTTTFTITSGTAALGAATTYSWYYYVGAD